MRRLTLDFLKTEAASGAFLAIAAAAALIAANSPWSAAYFALLHHQVPIQFGPWRQVADVEGWVERGLMSIFFFVVGLEIKYEVLRGELSNPRRLALPVLAALGGMIVPAGVYLAINTLPGGDPRGWSVPVATDIAFALAAFAFVGAWLPASLRVFLLTLAIADDLGAVVIIAVAYTRDLRIAPMVAAGAVLAGMALLSRWPHTPRLLYALGFLLVWACTLDAGINGSLAGVAAAMTIPIDPRRPGQEGLLKHTVESLHPYVAFGILPAFAFTASGLSLRDLSPSALLGPVPLGVALGLLIGKQIGVFGASALAVRLGVARKPTGATWHELYGVSVLCGVGFTMSLFLGGLAFHDGEGAPPGVKLGVLAGSLASAALGAMVLAGAGRARRARAAEEGYVVP